MTRLSAKIETEVISPATRSITSVPTIARPPTSSGSIAATRLRKKSSERTNRNGNANSSARRRSLSTWALTCFWATAEPPTVTPGSPASESAIRSPASWASSSPVGFSETARYVERPSRETKAAEWVEAKLETAATSGSAPTRSASASTRRAPEAERGSTPSASTITLASR